MSDTDDTDALLTCDPNGGLENYLGKTMDDVSSRQLEKSQTATLNTSSSRDSTLEPKSKAKMNKESTLDASDYFNSDGELILSGLSQLGESSVSDFDVTGHKNDHDSTSREDESNHSGETSGTVDSNSNTVEAAATSSRNKSRGSNPEDHSKKDKNRKNGKTDDEENNSDRKISNYGPAGCNQISKISKVQEISKADVPKDIQDDLRLQLLNANKSNPEIQNMLESDTTHIAYGVLNLNLNDLKSFATGLSRCNYFPPSMEKVTTYKPTRNEKGEKIFARAPNFRTPGGYRPPKHQRKCRDLTEDQIREEVRKMYAFPDAEYDEGNKEPEGSRQQAKEDSSSNAKVQEEGNSKSDARSSSGDSKPKVQFNFLDGTPAPNEFGKGKSGKPIKRKLLPNAGGICGGNVGSIPDLGFGLRNVSSDEVIEAPVERSVAWNTGISQEAGNSEKIGSKENINIQKFSFGYGEEDMSPIKPSIVSPAGCVVNSSLLQSERIQHTPETTHSEGDSEHANVIKQSTRQQDVKRYASYLSKKLDKVEKRRHLKEKFVATTHLSTPTFVPSVSGERNIKYSSPKRRLIKKAATKFRGMAAALDKSAGGSDLNDDSDAPTGSIASDLEKILSEIEMPADELESLIENLDDEDGDFTDIPVFFDDAAIEGNFVDAFTQLKLDVGKSNDSEHFSEKFHAEKFKREQCEKELRNLQECLLTEKQQNAVLEGTLKRRNVMLMQITMAFNRVCKEWKKIDSESKATVSKLQHDQKVFAAACKQSQERIAQYEKELLKTLELADSFKSRLVEVQNERDESILILKEANNELEGRVSRLKEEMGLLKTERDATLRALRESQIKLDEEKRSLETLEAHVKALEDKGFESSQKYEELLQAKSLQDSNYMEVVTRRNELEAMVVNLTSELTLERSSKDQLRRELYEEAERKTRLEAERLHEYYNKKVQEILKAATEEAAKAEAVLRDQIKRAAVESERKFNECKEKYLRELDMLRVKYETEIEKLKRENLHRQLLISSTVKQLQLGESSNLNVSGANYNAGVLQRTDVEIDAAQGCAESGENTFKPNCRGASNSQLNKFTLDHLPATVSKQQSTNGAIPKGSHITDLHDELPFGVRQSSFARFKTSTPIDAHTKADDTHCAGGDHLKYKSLANDPWHEGSSCANINKVCNGSSDKPANSVGSDCADFKNVLSHFLEAPVKPEKEQHQINHVSFLGKFSENPLDPSLQRCIQDLLKSYADKQDESLDNGGAHATTSNNANVNKKSEMDACNKNDCESSSSTNYSEREVALSTSESQTSQEIGNSNKLESQKSKKKGDLSYKGQQSSFPMKPPWK